MDLLFKSRLAIVWVALSLVTLLSWAVGFKGSAALQPDFAISMAVVAFAVIKARFVLREFMEVAHASKWLRVGSDVWVVAFFLAILAVYSG